MSKEKECGKKGGLRELLAVKAELPSDLLFGKFRVEIRGRNQVFVGGCKRIVKYSTEEMILSAGEFAVSITGERLVCSTYLSGTVSIDGYVTGVNFTDDEGEARE